MALVKVKPTSNGRRAVVKLVNPDLHKGTSVPALTEKKNRKSGRNNAGRITMRHQGGGHKQNYRVIDFLRSKDGIPAKVERFEYDPNRSANPALLFYADGARWSDDPGRPSARRRRRQDGSRPRSGEPVGHSFQRLQDAQEQAHARNDRPVPPQEVRI